MCTLIEQNETLLNQDSDEYEVFLPQNFLMQNLLSKMQRKCIYEKEILEFMT